MDLLAKETGGKATYNGNDFLEAVGSDINHGSRYYTLAYTPANNRELGKERKIDIKTISGKYKLAYRRSYFEDSARMSAGGSAGQRDPLRQLMDRGMPNFTELSYREKLEPATVQPTEDAPRAGDNAALKAPFTRYSVNLALAPEGLGLVPGPDGVRRGKVEVAMVAFDQQGKPLNWQVHFMGIAIRPEQNAIAEASGIPLHFDFDLPQGDVYLRTGIYDASTSKAGTLELQLNSATPAPQ